VLYSPAHGDVAQLGERGLCKPEAEGSSPFVSTKKITGRRGDPVGPFVFEHRAATSRRTASYAKMRPRWASSVNGTASTLSPSGYRFSPG
jgi:hypothetical protein